MDILTAAVGGFSFGIFLLVHGIIFRWVRPERLLRSLLVCVIAMAGVPLLLMGILYSIKAVDAAPVEWAGAAVLALVVQGLLCFVYVLCIFGPYETSVRMRLVREIDKAGTKGISLEALLGRYNAGTIVDLRLRRLMGSGDITEKDGVYRVSRGKNLFFIFDAIAGILKKWIKKP